MTLRIEATCLFLGILYLCGSTPKIFAENNNTRDLALQVARVAANEGSLVHRQETALIWQVVRNSGARNAQRLAFLDRHSARVAGTKPCLYGNCLWSPRLNRDGIQPVGLDLRADIWALRIRPIWLDTLRYADWLVSGMRRVDDPCGIRPRTWGGSMDREKAILRGLYPIGCFDPGICKDASCNDGYTYYKDCWKDGLWACDKTAEPAVQSEFALEELLASVRR